MPLRLDRWEETKRLLNKLGPQWTLRGQRDAWRSLTLTLERSIVASDWYRRREREEILLERFQRVARHYLRPGALPEQNNKLEWLSLMQREVHRLIDTRAFREQRLYRKTIGREGLVRDIGEELSDTAYS